MTGTTWRDEKDEVDGGVFRKDNGTDGFDENSGALWIVGCVCGKKYSICALSTQ